VNELSNLLELVERGMASAQDYQRIRELINSDESLIEQVHAFHSKQADSARPYDFPYWEQAVKEILEVDKVAPQRRFIINRWLRYAAAVLLIAGATTYLVYHQKPTHTIAVIPKDIPPGGNKATLTLGNGTTIVLDSAANGSLAQQGNTKIVKVDAGALSYNSGAQQGEVLYNTIRTPKGGQFQIILPDGSKVWLNAESSIRFPTAFTGKTRAVSVTGEVYMEIAKNAAQPFSVQVAGNTIDVLGTSFNINAYTDEAAVKTTLIEGSVKVNNIILKPGQQAIGRRQIEQADISQVIAWKNGLFSFTDADLPTVMRQLSRWYNIEVVYEGKVPERAFNGEIGRSLTFTQVMKLLSKTHVNYKLENGNRVIIYP
jgi:transmembrane sensor